MKPMRFLSNTHASLAGSICFEDAIILRRIVFLIFIHFEFSVRKHNHRRHLFIFLGRCQLPRLIGRVRPFPDSNSLKATWVLRIRIWQDCHRIRGKNPWGMGYLAPYPGIRTLTHSTLAPKHTTLANPRGYLYLNTSLSIQDIVFQLQILTLSIFLV